MKKKILNLTNNQAYNYLWWFLQIILTVLSVFFAFVGYKVLMASYELKDPFSFIITFFASNFIILISLTLFASFIWRMIAVYRKLK